MGITWVETRIDAVDEAGGSSSRSREQDKAFENALATYPEDSTDRWEKIAGDVPGKTLEEIKHHYDLLVDDVNRIESGFVPLPAYNSFEGSTSQARDEGTDKKVSHVGHYSESNHGSKSRSDQERRKGIAWKEDENRLFLLGLDKCAKGDWRSISRNFVVTRTPTQVASHAQKYFLWLNSTNKDRRRSSIHGITNIGKGEILAPQGSITGQTNGSVAGGSFGQYPTMEFDGEVVKSNAPKLEVKPLIGHLKYVFLGEEETLPIITSNKLSETEEEKLTRVFHECKEAIRWTIADIKGISSSTCMH
ncbi:transcription factor SRM1-like [Carica papaya]|uniref:transcription factor SRM1-like n=1 Tax=Carica papaya TaxID=3649 RepID=UPI000B8C878B|nr:transcription factor SRM1-like [Carica papaya]